jgi:NADPH:quinone reductase-like Zn-dependent oxidoreductase
MTAMMRAAVMYEAGGPEVLKVERRPVPTPEVGEVLIRVKSFGLNRSEMFTRQGHSPSVKFPRILGIEATGLVEEAPGNEFQKGDIVATAMGGMGRQFDGGYAEYTCVPAKQVQVLKTGLPWETLGALPEMLQTAWGSLFKSLRLERGDHLLIRGGTTSVGLAAAAIAKSHGAVVAATTRRSDRASLLRESGADEVFIDTGTIAGQVRAVFPGGVDKVLELVGTTTLLDSLRCAKQRGIVCLTGIVGNEWSLANFSPMDAIPTAVCLTSYSGEADDFLRTPLDELVQQIAAGTLRVQVGKTFHLDEIAEAHRCMEENRAGGKIVVLT